MKKIAIIAAALVAVSLGIEAAQTPQADDSLRRPRLTTKPEKMLVVEAPGAPNTAGQAAFGLLFKTFFSLPGARMAPPRARWSGDFAAAKDSWTGFYALPLPETVTSLPAGPPNVKIDVWKYGEVAEILHLGPYDTEKAAIETLHNFIRDNGYVIASLHEEEYLVGPGMGAEPSAFRTIIRYAVKKK
jgi:hypothetical protein